MARKLRTYPARLRRYRSRAGRNARAGSRQPMDCQGRPRAAAALAVLSGARAGGGTGRMPSCCPRSCEQYLACLSVYCPPGTATPQAALIGPPPGPEAPHQKMTRLTGATSNVCCAVSLAAGMTHRG
jgi:hypothetical protein